MVLGLLLAWLFLPLAAVGSIVRSPSAAWSAVGRSKGMTALLVILAGAVGGAYCFIRIRMARLALAAAG